MKETIARGGLPDSGNLHPSDEKALTQLQGGRVVVRLSKRVRWWGVRGQTRLKNNKRRLCNHPEKCRALGVECRAPLVTLLLSVFSTLLIV